MTKDKKIDSANVAHAFVVAINTLEEIMEKASSYDIRREAASDLLTLWRNINECEHPWIPVPPKD